MNKFLVAIFVCLSVNVYAQESCQVIEQDVNTPTPKELKDAEIIVRTKDGKEQKMSANDFKVVKRKQQFKVKEVVQKQPCEPTVVEKVVEVDRPNEPNKNLVMLGVRHDFTDLGNKVEGNKITLYSQKSLVFDLSYLRRQVLNTKFGLGIGLDTNTTFRGILGYEF